MKKINIPLFLILIIHFGLIVWTGCGNTTNNSDEWRYTNADSTNREEVYSAVYAERIAEMTGEFKDDIYISNKGQFKIKFPEAPEVKWAVAETDLGSIDLYSYLYETADKEVFMVSFNDYPNDFINKENPYSMLKTLREWELKKLNVQVEDEIEFTLGQFPAIRSYAIAQTENMYIVYQSVIANNRFFQLMIAKEGEYPSKGTISSFLDSFEILM